MIEIRQGKMELVLPELEAESFDSCCCDPPYFLTSIVKRFGSDNAAPAKSNGATGVYARASRGFMGRKWDAPELPPIDADFANWLAGFIDGEGCFSVHKKQVNGCETYDCQFTITLRADDGDVLREIQSRLGGIGSLAAREIRDGNPQARYCISSQADCAILREILTVFPLRAKKRRDFLAWSHALDCWLEHRQGDWEDMAYYRDALMAVKRYGSTFSPEHLWHYRWARQVYRVLRPGAYLCAFGSTRGYHRMACAAEDAGFIIHPMVAWIFASGFPKATNFTDPFDEKLLGFSEEDDPIDWAMSRSHWATYWEGWRYGGQALKPAIEPILVAQKPFAEPTGRENVLNHGTGALNIDASRVATGETVGWNGNARRKPMDGDQRKGASLGLYEPGERHNANPITARWPANVCHDGSPEVLDAFARFGESKSSGGKGEASQRTALNGQVYGDYAGTTLGQNAGGLGDTGTAARFFFCAKADASERVGSSHPTQKPVNLLKWLVTLVTPTGGKVLDPFAGTGTTLVACDELGFDALGIELSEEYVEDAKRKIEIFRARRFIGRDVRQLPPDPDQMKLFE